MSRHARACCRLPHGSREIPQATGAGLIGISRLSYSLAQNDLFPKAFSRLHSKFKTPYVSIIVFGIVAAALILPAQIDLLGAVYALAATFAFATAHLAVGAAIWTFVSATAYLASTARVPSAVAAASSVDPSW